jgi:hypothetical protein
MKHYSFIRSAVFTLLFFISFKMIAQQKDSVNYGFITMNDEISLSGKIVIASAKTVVINDFTLGQVTVETKNIAHMEIVNTGTPYRFTLYNGKTYSGKVENQTDSTIDVSTQSIGIIHLKPEQIKSVLNLEGQKVVNGKTWFPNPHATRYLFMPSSIPLKKGQGYFQNAMIDVNSMTYGISDHVSVGIGFAVPYAYMGTLRAGYKVAKNIYVGAGGIYAGTFFNIGLGLAAGFANITFGNENSNVSVAAGYGFVKVDTYNNNNNAYNGVTTYSTTWNSTHGALITVCGMVRLANRFALVSENWFFPVPQREYHYQPYPSYSYTTTTSYPYDEVLSLGFRTMWEKSSFDLAIGTEIKYLANGGSNLPAFPYLDYVFKF